MTTAYKIIYRGGEGEWIEKKSRFIATILPAENESAAIKSIETTKKKYWNATHNCFAYLIGINHEIQRCSDDGEPSGTAGKPMLDVLLGEDIHNICVIVTRYFGGTLLGTGGLVRAYSKTVQEGLKNSIILSKNLAKKYNIYTDYSGIGKIQYIINQLELIILSTEYTNYVQLCILSPLSKADMTIKKIREATSGKAKVEELEEVYYSKHNGEVILF